MGLKTGEGIHKALIGLPRALRGANGTAFTKVPCDRGHWAFDVLRRQIRFEHIGAIGAGWKTDAVYAWVCRFYAHRQRKWNRLLDEKGAKRAVS